MRPRRAAAVLVPLLLLLLAGGLRFARVDEPARIMFDERHYVPDAREYLDQGVEIERPAHPPAGKWLIAASIAAVGDRPLGWRLASATAGTVVVAATYLMGRRLAGPRWVAALAALLVSVDGLALTMSRIAMLDGIQAAFVTVGALFALYDRRSAHRRWRWAAGITLGIGVAVKWSSASVLVLAVGLALFTELSSRRRSGGPSLLATAARVAVPLVAVPAAIYVVSYAGWFASVDRSETGRDRCGAGCSIAEALSGWGFEQWDMVDVQRRLEPTHPDRSKPLAWLTLSRPVLTYAAACPPGPAPDDDCDVAPGTQARIFGVGNPALWWPALLAYPSLGWLALRRRDGPAAFVLACIAVQVLPWFASWKPGFAFYMTPVVPFIALALALSLARATGRWPPARVLPVAIAVAAIAGAIWLYPIWTGIELSPSALDARLWFAD